MITSFAKCSCGRHFLLAAVLGNECFIEYGKSHVLLLKHFIDFLIQNFFSVENASCVILNLSLLSVYTFADNHWEK